MSFNREKLTNQKNLMSLGNKLVIAGALVQNAMHILHWMT